MEVHDDSNITTSKLTGIRDMKSQRELGGLPKRSLPGIGVHFTPKQTKAFGRTKLPARILQKLLHFSLCGLPVEVPLAGVNCILDDVDSPAVKVRESLFGVPVHTHQT